MIMQVIGKPSNCPHNNIIDSFNTFNNRHKKIINFATLINLVGMPQGPSLGCNIYIIIILLCSCMCVFAWGAKCNLWG